MRLALDWTSIPRETAPDVVRGRYRSSFQVRPMSTTTGNNLPSKGSAACDLSHTDGVDQFPRDGGRAAGHVSRRSDGAARRRRRVAAAGPPAGVWLHAAPHAADKDGFCRDGRLRAGRLRHGHARIAAPPARPDARASAQSGRHLADRAAGDRRPALCPRARPGGLQHRQPRAATQGQAAVGVLPGRRPAVLAREPLASEQSDRRRRSAPGVASAGDRRHDRRPLPHLSAARRAGQLGPAGGAARRPGGLRLSGATGRSSGPAGGRSVRGAVDHQPHRVQP